MDGVDAPRFFEDEPKMGWFRAVHRFIQRRTKTVNVTAAYSVAADVYWVRADATSGAFAVTLPAASEWWGRTIGIIKTDTSANAVTCTAAGADVINGAATALLPSRYSVILLHSDGVSSWDILEYTIPATLWTPVLTFVTPNDLAVTYSSQVGAYSRHLNTVTAHFSIITSAFTHTTAAGNLRITGLPFTVANSPAGIAYRGAMTVGGITKAGYTSFVAAPGATTTFLGVAASGSGVAVANVAVGDMPTGGTVQLQGTVIYEA